MDKWLGPALGGLALLIAGYSAVSTYGMQDRLAALEMAQVAHGGDRVRGERIAGERGRGPRGEGRRRQTEESGEASREEALVRALEASQTASGTATFDLQDPAVRAQLLALVEEEEQARREERHIARSEAFMQSVRDELDVFAEEHGIQDDTKSQVLVELERRHEEFSSLRHESREGNISRFDARREMDALREDSDAVLSDLLGADDFAALDQQLWGDDGGRRGPRRP